MDKKMKNDLETGVIEASIGLHTVDTQHAA